MLTEKIISQLADRGITEEIASRLSWTASDNGMLEIPYFRNGVKVGTKFRTLTGKKKFYQEDGSEQCLYNLDAIKEIGTSPLVITEGELDAAIALQCGHIAVSVPNGAPSKPVEGEGTKYDYLKDIPPGIEIIICADGDEQGANLLHDLSIRLKPARCKWVKYPKGCKDLNEAFIKFGSKGVDETIRRAQWCKIDGIYSLSELPPPPTAIPLDCPVHGLADNFKIRLGDFTVISGLPGFGKTTLVNEIACGMVSKYGWHVAIASFEQSPKIDHLRALRTYQASSPAHLLNDAARANADEWIEHNFTFIVPDIDDSVTLKWVYEHVEAAIIRKGAKLIIIDPWNELDHEYPREMTLTQYTGFAIKQFKKLAQKYMVHIIVVAHPAKLQKNKDGTYPIPSLYDISDSSHWFNKCDIGIIVHREGKTETIVKICKVRYWNIIGRPDEIKLTYDDYRGRFELSDRSAA